MSLRHTALPLALTAVFALASCESSTPPLAPSPATAHAVGVPSGDSDGVETAAARKPASDGAFVIKHGALEFAGPGGEAWLRDQRGGFSLVAGVTRTGGIVSAITTCFASSCAPGDSIPLLAYWSDNDFHATVTLDGTTYPRLGDMSGRYGSAWIRFDGTAYAPPLNKRGSTKVTAPFTMEGGFSVPGHPFMSYSGGGTVTIWLAHEPWSTGWRVTRLLYELRNQPPRVGQTDRAD